MEKQQLTQIFSRYLEGEATKDEIRVLLDAFGQDKDSPVLRRLIRESYENAKKERISLQTHESLSRVKKLLREKITLQQQKKVRYMRVLRFSAAAVLIIAAGIAYLQMDALRDRFNPVVYQTVSTIKGQRKQIALEDGSTIWLAPQSRVVYPNEFRGKLREVKLNGEAFFEVAKDKRHPFIVHSGNVETKVLGTTFNIQAYQDELAVSITLLTGKVRLQTAGGKQMDLVPNQRAIYNKLTTGFKKLPYPQASQMLDRRNGLYHYDGTPVLQIIADLQRDYNFTIDIEGDFTHCTFYGDYHDGDDPYLFLRKVCRVINAQFIRNETGIKIIGKGC
ncbi:FecR domain-containing protein [Mucilaginibacter sp. RS28]|uniref:FecR domain-containing protein n=1 Tax=Mucilaginibacter straminoryzae TaxID=2932774 RepID=A0A9X1WZN2_9SPHI|nr:FecR family protein [Mucilaginibacter straminoryzae]MCJ8208091.1 FecR domain-containing protein [Mucilaginibacter straminoryzae]